jgi:hypothetical protein
MVRAGADPEALLHNADGHGRVSAARTTRADDGTGPGGPMFPDGDLPPVCAGGRA